MSTHYDVIVVGAGHAGCEAALAASRMGCRTLLLTMSLETIGHMSCNPAIGGLAKGQLVKEIDALGGQMAKTADATAIQFRTLNTRKGPAVHSTRAQIDRHAYRLMMKAIIETQANLETREGTVEHIACKGAAVESVTTTLGETYRTTTLIVTPGTFMHGLIHIGLNHFPGGRIGEPHAEGLAQALAGLGIVLGRLKTGTCARIDGRTIDFTRCTPQHGDEDVTPFSFESTRFTREQLPCYITYTNTRTHDIIRNNLDRSPLFTGIIKGTGVRYCPSIEDKIYRFPHRDRHHIFLEPEGLNTIEYYPNGISTSLPVDAQEDLIHSIEGLERAVITRPGYGIEYDYADPTQLYPTLETKNIHGLYLAGQINGTTGYEEAAALGLMAGINAALSAQGKPELVLGRNESYIGVLIDDLVTKGTKEPYRMFTSRVEYRLLLREGNADIRLTPIGHALGLIGDERYAALMQKKDRIEGEIARLKQKRLERMLRRPGVTYGELVSLDPDRPAGLSVHEVREIETEIKYEGFIARQLSDVARMEKIEKIKIPADIDYAPIHSLSAEIKEKLTAVKPRTLGQASRISGVTPASITILMIYLEKTRRATAANRHDHETI